MKLNIGENIRKNRTCLGWTQTQLAEQLGTSVQSVSRWESGGGYPDMELLPELARLFGVSMDELVGYGKKGEKSDLEELRNKLYSVVHGSNPSAKEAAQILRRIRLDHPRDAVWLTTIFLHAPLPDTEHTPELLRELRLVGNLCDRQESSMYTQTYFRTMAKYEDDEHFRQLVKPYKWEPNLRMDQHTLLLDRAEAQGDAELYHKVRQMNMIKNLYAFLRDESMMLKLRHADEADSLPQADVSFAAAVSETKLQILHTFCGMHAEAQYPLSANGCEDMWTPLRIKLGRIYAAQLSALGQYERALTVLEDIATLTEHSCTFSGDILPAAIGPNPPQFPVTVYSPLLPDIGAYKQHFPIGYIEFCFSCSDARSSFGFMGSVNLPSLLTFLTKHRKEVTDNFRTSWLDPIRDHPRYIAVVERIRACRENLGTQ